MTQNAAPLGRPPLQDVPHAETIQSQLDPSPAASTIGEGPRILLVEDSNANANVMGAYLTALGYEYDTVTDGLEAVKRAQSGDYIAALMDIQLPMMDGVEAATHIRNNEQAANRKRLPIFAMTSHYLATDRDMCLRAGMDDYFTKPIRQTELQDLLNALTMRAAALA